MPSAVVLNRVCSDCAVRADGAGGEAVLLGRVAQDGLGGGPLGRIGGAGVTGGAGESGVVAEVVGGVEARGLEVLRDPGDQADRGRDGGAGKLPDGRPAGRS